MNLKAMHWVITGAKGNVGSALTDAVLAKGNYVFGIDYGREKKVIDFNQRYIFLEGDLTDIKDVQRIMEIIMSKKQQIHVWVNVVGGFAMGNPVEKTDEKDWRKMMDLNFHTTLNCCNSILPHMKSNRFGRIINFGSVAAMNGMAYAAPYAVSKAAVVALTKTIALEGKDLGITCNVIVPTIIDTPQNRQAMPKADYSTWTKPETIATKIIHVVHSESNGELILV